jgi:hypothetical protein
MMRPEDRAREMLAESRIPEAGSTRLLESLTELGRSVDEVEPLPGPELASLMARTSRGATGPSRRRRARLMVATAVAVGTVGAGGLAAAANELPDGAQDLVANFSERYLPFDLPRSGAAGTGPDSRFAPAPQTPPSSRETEHTGVPALSPAGGAPEGGGTDGRARDEVASQRVSEPSPRAPSLDDPRKTRPSPAPAPADDAPLVEDGEDVGGPGGAAGPEADEVPATEAQTGGKDVPEKPSPEASSGAGAGTGPDATPGKAAEKSKGGERRGPGVREKPSAAPADGGDG